MMSVPVVKQAIPSSGGGTSGPVGGGPGAGPPSSQSPGKMVTTTPQPGTNILPKSANPGNPMVGSMGGHSVGQAGGIAQNLQNSSLMKQVPPAASSMPISMVANHTASAQSMVHQSLSGVSGGGTMAPLSLVPEHRTPTTGVPQPTPPVAHNHPTPPMPTQRGSAPPAHSTAPPSTHPPQSGPSGGSMMGGGMDKPKELIVGGKPTSNGVQMQKVGEASGAAQQQARKVSDGPVSLVVNHSIPEASGNTSTTNVTPQQTQPTHPLTTPAHASGAQAGPAKPDSAVANHTTSQPSKSGLAPPTAPAAANKVSPAPSPIKDKTPTTPTKSVPATAAPKAPATAAAETNDAPAKSATPAASSAPQSTTSQATTVKAPAATAGASPAKPSTAAAPAPATAAAVPAATTAPSESTGSSTQGTGASEAPADSTASPAKPAATPASSTAVEEPKVNNEVSSDPAKTASENQATDATVATPTEAEPATPVADSTADKEGKANTPPSATPSRGSKRKRAEVKIRSPAPTLGSSQAAAIAAASRTPSSKNKIQSDLGSAKKEEGGEDDDDEDRKPKRVRIRTQPYQSPLPELAYLPKFTRTPTSKAQEDKLILFYKNEFLAVRNAEGGFYVCQTMQNIYKHSARIRIRWLSQDTTPKTDEEKDQSTNDGEVYSPDFYDLTDFDCILTNLNLDRLERGKYRLPNVELERTQSILKRALDAEKGVGQKTPLTEEHPDGLDLSLYRDESQLKKRRSHNRKSGAAKTKNADEAKEKQEDGKDNDSSSSSSSSSEDEAEEADESSAKKPKREKRAAPPPTPKETATPATPRARGARETGKRKAGAESEGKAKATPSSATATAATKKRNNSSTPARKRRSEAPAAAAPATTPARATPARATRSPKSAPAPSRKERSRVKEARKKPGKKA